jgi:simple sugar transport system permease protein
MLTLILLAAMLAGAIWGFIPGYLKARFNVHEVVSTIMLNWVAYWVVYYTIPAHFKANLETESARIPDYASLKVSWLTQFFHGSFINLGVFVAIACAVLTAIVLNKSVLGYELKAVGYSKTAAEFAGINVAKNMALSLGISGALAGLAGATFYVGYAVNMQIGVMPTQGMDAIAVEQPAGGGPRRDLLRHPSLGQGLHERDDGHSSRDRRHDHRHHHLFRRHERPVHAAIRRAQGQDPEETVICGT